jgi:hypothetical protein
MKLNKGIADGNRILFQIYLPSNCLTQIFYYVILHNVQCISVRRCLVDVSGMFILYRHW